MRLIAVYLCAVFVAVAVGGCAAWDLDEGWAPPRPLGRELAVYTPPVDPSIAAASPPVPEPFEAPTGDLTLREALAAALLNNPELAAFAWEVRVAEARALQKSLYPNPELEAEVESIGRTGGAAIGEATIRLAQPILTAGKLEKRTHLAELRAQLAGWDYEAKRLDVFTQVVRRFIDVLAARRRLEVARQTHELAQQVFETVSKQVEAGAVSPIERQRAEVELSRSRVKLERAKRALKSARLALAQSMGLPEPTFERIVGELTSVEPVPPLQILEELIAQNPAIARWEDEIAAARTAVELAEARAWPNLTPGAGVKRFGATDETAAVLSLSLPLPIIDRNQGNILEARYNLIQTLEKRQAAMVRVRTELGRAYQDLQAAHDAALILARQTLPAARSTYEAVLMAYRQGERGFLDVLIAQRTLFEVRSQYVDALAQYHTAAAEVERLIAQSLDEVGEEPSVPPDEATPEENIEGNMP